MSIHSIIEEINDLDDGDMKELINELESYGLTLKAN